MSLGSLKPNPPLATKIWYAAHLALLVLVEKPPTNDPVYGTKKRILKLTNGKPHCHICGLRIFLRDNHNLPESFSIDHVIPLSKGGTNAPENKRPAHQLCNLTKDSPRVTDKTKAKLKRMRDRIRQRMAQEA